MITINSFLHRDALNDIIRRWMYDEARPSDADLITRLVHFNHIYVSRYLDFFAERIFRELHAQFSSRHVQIKGDLKDALVADPPYRNERIDGLIRDYHQNPGRYYRETPFHGTLYFTRRNGYEAYIGSSRIKRSRRLAEKAARRIIDRIFDQIKRHADTLADERARLLGIPRERPPDGACGHDGGVPDRGRTASGRSARKEAHRRGRRASGDQRRCRGEDRSGGTRTGESDRAARPVPGLRYRGRGDAMPAGTMPRICSSAFGRPDRRSSPGRWAPGS